MGGHGTATRTRIDAYATAATTLAELCAAEGVAHDELDPLLAWARERAKTLVQTIDADSPLLALLELPTVLDLDEDDVELIEETTAPPDVGTTLRRHRRHRFEQPIAIACEQWGEFIELYTKDISHGGMFVQTPDPPPLHTQVTIHMRVPSTTVRELRITGEVIHVVSAELAARTGMAAGFGLQLVNITPARRRLLELVVEHARAVEAGHVSAARRTSSELERSASASSSALRLCLTDAEQHELADLEAQLDTARATDDRTLLGLGEHACPDEIRTALARTSQRWHDVVSHGPMELRAIGHAMLRRLEQAAETLERSVRVRSAVAEPIPEKPEPRGHRLAELLRRAKPKPKASAIFAEAAQAINEKRYVDAIERLAPFSRRSRGDARAAALLSFAEARLFAQRGEIDRAIEKYEDVLRLQPDHRVAERDLTILRCL